MVFNVARRLWKNKNRSARASGQPNALLRTTKGSKASTVSGPSSAANETDGPEETADDNESTTVLSDMDAEEDEVTIDLLHLEKHFALRDELFEQIIAEKDSEYVRIAKEYEEAMRALLLQRDEAQQGDNDERSLPIKPPSLSTRLLCWNRTLVFSEALVGYATIILYCVAHLSCWEVLTAIVYEGTRNWKHQTALHAMLLFGSLIILRLSGGIFAWVDPETYELAKANLERRRKLGAWDGRVIQWFRRHDFIKTFVNTAAFYVCWIAVAYFETWCLRFVDKRHILLKGLPSAAFEIMTVARNKIEPGQARELEECVDNACQLEEELEYEDSVYLYSELSISSYYQLMGDESAPLISTRGAIAFYVTAGTISITILALKLRHYFGKF